MSNSLLAPTAIDQVRKWLDASDVVRHIKLPVAHRSQFAGAWELKEHYPHLGGIRPRILLPRDFPFTPLRVELDPDRCLHLPHIEATGNFCHGVVSEPSDLNDPVRAAGRVLNGLLDYVERSADTKWIEAEFQRESHDYWLRYAAAANPPKGYRTDELLLDVNPDVEQIQRAEALSLASRTRAIVSTREGGPKAVAAAIGWPLGTIVQGSAVIAPLPQQQRWTPDVWPKSFNALAVLLDDIADSTKVIRTWYHSRTWPAEAPLFIVLLHGPVAYGWQIIRPRMRSATPLSIVPIKVTRIDRRWALARDYERAQLDVLTEKKVVVFGCGSLGAPTIELLARAGIGSLDIVDPDVMKPENISRHPLGLRSIGCYKAEEICARLKRGVPGLKLASHTCRAQQWLAETRPSPNLILDCTGERAVRMAISQARRLTHEAVPIMMVWMEPFGAAGHVVTVVGTDSWPLCDPAESAINIATWPDDVERRHPGCGHGYHPFGMSDAWEVASLATRRAIALLRGEEAASDVVSLVRQRAYFEHSSSGSTFRRDVAIPPGVETVVERRPLAEALRGV